MNESMRKIIYYENILEFKQNSRSQLALQEVNNWQLCRTCLAETHENDMDLDKMCVMDAMEGRLLTVLEMLIKVTPLQDHKHLGLPRLRICKECFVKTTTMYFFYTQVTKAEEVLKKLLEQLNVTSKPEKHPNDNEIIEERDEEPNVNCADTELIPEESEQSLDSTNQTDDVGETSLISNDCDGDENEEETLKEAEIDEEVLSVSSILNKQECETDVLETINEDNRGEEYLEKSIDAGIVNITAGEESHNNLDNDFDVTDEMLDEVYIIEQEDETEQEIVSIEATGELSKMSKQSPKVRKRKKSEKSAVFQKHKQPRVTKPLLENVNCAVCEKIFERQCDLVSHVRQNHPNSKAFRCRDCGVLFSHTQSLSRHMNTHKPNVNKNTCEYCSKGFLRPEDLKRHIRVHTGERPYPCPLCEKSFKQRSEMTQHMTIHLEHKQYQCPLCERAFGSRNSLYLHKKTHNASSSQQEYFQSDTTLSRRQGLLHQEQEIHENGQCNTTVIVHVEE